MAGGGLPLAGRTVVMDPGHQLGNHNFPSKINRLVPAGGFKKPCNTTGTATNGGYPEATFAWRVARLLGARLEGSAREVGLTRHTNRQDRWGPCVDVRGRAGNRRPPTSRSASTVTAPTPPAPAASTSSPRPTAGRGPTTSTARRGGWPLDTRAALRSRPAAPVANYIAGGDGLDFRSDLGTLNLSDIPTVMVELGNMRNPPTPTG